MTFLYPQIFHANTDPAEVVLNRVPQPVLARFVRIRPQTWKNGIALRFELYGCQITGVCVTIHIDFLFDIPAIHIQSYVQLYFPELNRLAFFGSSSNVIWDPLRDTEICFCPLLWFRESSCQRCGQINVWWMWCIHTERSNTDHQHNFINSPHNCVCLCSLPHSPLVSIVDGNPAANYRTFQLYSFSHWYHKNHISLSFVARLTPPTQPRSRFTTVVRFFDV